MTFKEIQEKLINEKYYILQSEIITRDLYSRIYNLIEWHSDIEDSPELAKIIDAVAEALSGIQAEALELGYKTGVNDTIEELKKAGLTDFDITSQDLSQFEITEADKKEFEKLEKELEQLDT